jgi:urease accessory protein
VKALARIVAEADAGRTRLVELYGEVPLLPRATGVRAGPVAEVHLVGGAAGPLGGDELTVEVHVGAGASLIIRTVAATLALPGDGCSTTRVDATVAAGGTLHWLPEPIVAVRGCDHLTESVVQLYGDAQLRWREELVCGRHGEEGGDLVLQTRVRLDGRSLYRQDLAVGPRADSWSGPAVLGGARTAGSVILVGPADALPAPSTVDGGALMRLAGPGVVASAVADHAHDLRRALDTLLPVTKPGRS